MYESWKGVYLMGELHKIKTAAEKLNDLISKSSFSKEKKESLYFTTDRLKRWARTDVIRSNRDSNAYFISEDEFENILKLNVLITLEGKTIEQSKKELMIGSVLEKEEQLEENRSTYGRVIEEALVKYRDDVKAPIERNTESVDHVNEKLTEFEKRLLEVIGNMGRQIEYLTEQVGDLHKKSDEQKTLLENQAPLLLGEKKDDEDILKSEKETKKEIAAAVSEQTETITKEMEELKKTVQQQQLLLEKQENEKTTENKKRKGFFSRMFSGEK